MSAVSRACATSAEAMPGAEPAPAQPRQGRHADDLADLGAVDVDRLVGADGDRLAVLDGDHHHRAAGGDPLAQHGRPGARLGGRRPRGRSPHVGGDRPGGRTRWRRPAGSAAARDRRRPTT